MISQLIGNWGYNPYLYVEKSKIKPIDGVKFIQISPEVLANVAFQIFCKEHHIVPMIGTTLVFSSSIKISDELNALLD